MSGHLRKKFCRFPAYGAMGIYCLDCHRPIYRRDLGERCLVGAPRWYRKRHTLADKQEAARFRESGLSTEIDPRDVEGGVSFYSAPFSVMGGIAVSACETCGKPKDPICFSCVFERLKIASSPLRITVHVDREPTGAELDAINDRARFWARVDGHMQAQVNVVVMANLIEVPLTVGFTEE